MVRSTVNIAADWDSQPLPDLAGRLSTGPPPSQQEVVAIAERWRPYRSLATSYLFSAAFEPAEALPVARHGSA